MPARAQMLTSKSFSGRAWIGAGSRDGNRRRNLAAALRRLGDSGLKVAKVSSLYETEPVDLPGGATLLNAAVEVASLLPPRDLLELCLAVERGLGRRREAGREGPRPIDLDILLYADRIVREPDLTIPHPRMHERRFVLVPLAEIALDVRHPLLDRTVGELLRDCRDPAWVRPVAPPYGWSAEA